MRQLSQTSPSTPAQEASAPTEAPQHASPNTQQNPYPRNATTTAVADPEEGRLVPVQDQPTVNNLMPVFLVSGCSALGILLFFRARYVLVRHKNTPVPVLSSILLLSVLLDVS